MRIKYFLLPLQQEKSKTMKVLFNKVYYELLDEDEQPKNTIFQPKMDSLKKAKVLGVGSECTEVKEGDIITIHVFHHKPLEGSKGLIPERDVLFINDCARLGKIEIQPLGCEDLLTSFHRGRIVSSGCEELKPDDIIGYESGAGVSLPNNNELISKTIVYFKN